MKHVFGYIFLYKKHIPLYNDCLQYSSDIKYVFTIWIYCRVLKKSLKTPVDLYYSVYVCPTLISYLPFFYMHMLQDITSPK